MNMQMTGVRCVFLSLVLSNLLTLSSSLEISNWFAPFNESAKIYELCNNEMDKIVLESKDHARVLFYMEKFVACYTDYENYVPLKYRALVWLMKSLRYCEINQMIYVRPGIYHREFQLALLKYSYTLLCGKAHKIPQNEKFNLYIYSNIFRILYEKNNPERKFICDKITTIYSDLYSRCYVPHVEKRQSKIEDRCSGVSTPFIKTPAFFQRFSRKCHSLKKFISNNSLAVESAGLALSEDVVFMNLLNANLVTNINADSELPSLVLRTRLLLQHFSLAAVKLWNQLDGIRKCRVDIMSGSWNDTDSFSTSYEGDSEGNDRFGAMIQQKCCIYNNSHVCDLQNERKYRNLAEQAWRAFYIEFALLAAVLGNTVLLMGLLFKTKKHLSTATVLFVFNIIFSNILFLASFACLFSDFWDPEPYGPVNEDHLDKSPELIVAETLQIHLFADSESAKHLVQETLYSLAQNGSLTGLIHLLVLVLVVINRSMSGKSIHLSRVSVVSVFASVWLVLIVSHIVFSSLQINAIKYLDDLFRTLSKGRQYLQCSVENVVSDYIEIAGRCDRTAIFHAFGAYLLRGHTLFTVLFLSLSIIIFTVTLAYHWRVRRQHDFLHSGLRLSESVSTTYSLNEQSPHRRREMLFHTLLLSIGAFFISVMGQTYIELAVFWVDEREQVASITKWYHLARLAAFVDPVLNPLIVVIRTPALRRQLRAEWTSMRRSSDRSRESIQKRHTAIRSSSQKIKKRSASHREELEVCMKGDKTIIRASGTRRSLDSQTASVV